VGSWGGLGKTLLSGETQKREQDIFQTKVKEEKGLNIYLKSKFEGGGKESSHNYYQSGGEGHCGG